MENTYPYHQYFFFAVEKSFCALTAHEQTELKAGLELFLSSQKDLILVPYATLGFKVNTTFMLWCRANTPEELQNFIRHFLDLPIAQHLSLTYSYFGIERVSQYSGRIGKPEQVIQNFTDRLPYFILYPFTKTTEWYQLDFEKRKTIMGEHIGTGVSHATVRQCLLYSYGVDDYEFLVSYESATLEEFQDVVKAMRSTVSRVYTQSDTPIFTCIYKSLPDLISWL